MSMTAYLNGLAAEDIATRTYQAQGATLLATRWHCPAGEIDLIFRHGPLVIFAEVKARATRDAAAASLSSRQTARLMAAAEIYLADHCPFGQEARFDLVMIDKHAMVEVLPNCFG